MDTEHRSLLKVGPLHILDVDLISDTYLPGHLQYAGSVQGVTPCPWLTRIDIGTTSGPTSTRHFDANLTSDSCVYWPDWYIYTRGGSSHFWKEGSYKIGGPLRAGGPNMQGACALPPRGTGAPPEIFQNLHAKWCIFLHSEYICSNLKLFLK